MYPLTLSVQVIPCTQGIGEQSSTSIISINWRQHIRTKYTITIIDITIHLIPHIHIAFMTIIISCNMFWGIDIFNLYLTRVLERWKFRQHCLVCVELVIAVSLDNILVFVWSWNPKLISIHRTFLNNGVFKLNVWTMKLCKWVLRNAQTKTCSICLWQQWYLLILTY
jgi:hypothetical protein